MHPRIRLTLMAAVTLVLAGALIAVLVARPGRDAAAPGLQGARSPAGMPPVSLRLVDQDGRLADTRTLRGRPVIVTFLYTHCQDTCPVTAQQIKGALDDLGHDLPTLAISVDPARDTPRAARAFLFKQGLTGRMRFLLGPAAELTRAWRTFGIQPQEQGIDHSARVVVLDDTGRPAVAWPTDQLTPEGLAHDLRVLSAGRAGAG